MTGERTPRTRMDEAVDVSAVLSLLVRCDILQTICSGARLRSRPPRASGARMALTVDLTPGPFDGCGAEADDLDDVARLAQFDCLGLSP